MSDCRAKVESKEQHGVWDPMTTPESIPTHLPRGQPYAKVDLNPMPEATLSPSQGLSIWPQLNRSDNPVSAASLPLFVSKLRRLAN